MQIRRINREKKKCIIKTATQTVVYVMACINLTYEEFSKFHPQLTRLSNEQSLLYGSDGRPQKSNSPGKVARRIYLKSFPTSEWVLRKDAADGPCAILQHHGPTRVCLQLTSWAGVPMHGFKAWTTLRSILRANRISCESVDEFRSYIRRMLNKYSQPMAHMVRDYVVPSRLPGQFLVESGK